MDSPSLGQAGWLWIAWSSGGCPCPWQGMSFEVISTQTIPWFYDSAFVTETFSSLFFVPAVFRQFYWLFFFNLLWGVKISEVILISFMPWLSSTCAVCADVWSLSSRFSEEGMEVMERLIYLFRKFNQLKVSNEEYACMKAINFLNQGGAAKARYQPHLFIFMPQRMNL